MHLHDLWTVDYRDASEIVRRNIAPGSPWPIILVDGWKPPMVQGNEYYWTTASGSLVKYPSAYMKKFGRPIYNPSTKRIIVGLKWLYAKTGNYSLTKGV